jgi:hypothetical protein
MVKKIKKAITLQMERVPFHGPVELIELLLLFHRLPRNLKRKVK